MLLKDAPAGGREDTFARVGNDNTTIRIAALQSGTRIGSGHLAVIQAIARRCNHGAATAPGARPSREPVRVAEEYVG